MTATVETAQQVVGVVDGLFKREIIRCLMRFIARQAYHAIVADLSSSNVGSAESRRGDVTRRHS